MNGIINFLKPPGMSSNGAVGFFKKTLNYKKIGHAGTLDPGACGVLVILVGKATKLSDRLMAGTKEYIGQITFGATTDTQDSYGQVMKTDDKVVSHDELTRILPEFLGEIDQTPSKYSAIKVNGRKAYDLARAGKDFTLKSRIVTIEHLKVLHHIEKNRFLIKVRCSKGTYIRALFEDIGKRLNTCAYTSFLERSRSGQFDVANSVTADEAKAMVENSSIDHMLIPMDTVLHDLKRIDVFKSDYKKISNGVPARIESIIDDKREGEYKVYCNDVFFGIGEIIDDDKVKITTHLFGE